MDTPVFGGVIEIGQYVDFHYTDSRNDYDGRLFLDGNGDFSTSKGNLAYKSDLSSKAVATYYNGSDANTFASGLYLVERCKNTPDESTWWLVISFVHPAAKAGAQIAYGLINKNFKRRSLVSGEWDPWDNVIK